MLIEVCCGSVDDALRSERGGAHRIELNSSMFLGGITPSIGELIEAKKRLQIPVISMVRPRSGGFCYTESEFEVMKHDAVALIQAGTDGIVFGILKEDGRIDRERNAVLAEIGLKAGVDVVVHRAIDVVPSWQDALESLIEIGVQRVLTTGQRAAIEDGAHTVKAMVEQAKGRLQILPGGLKPQNMVDFSSYMGTDQAHIASFRPQQDSSCQYNREIYFGGALYPPEMQFDAIDESFVAEAVKSVTSFSNLKNNSC